MSRLGLSITNIFNVIAAEQPEETTVTPLGTQGEAGIVFFYEETQTENEFRYLEGITQLPSIVTALDYNNSGFESNYIDGSNPAGVVMGVNETKKISISQLNTFINNAALTVNSTLYSDWEMLTIPANESIETYLDGWAIWIFASRSPKDNYTENYIFKHGEAYKMVTNIVTNPPLITYEIVDLAFDSNGYLQAENTQVMLPILVREYTVNTNVAVTKVPLLLSAMSLVNSSSDILPTGLSNLTEYLNYLETEGTTSDTFITSQSSRYQLAGSYLNPNIDPSNLYPVGIPANKDKLSPKFPFAAFVPAAQNLLTTISTTNKQITVIINSFTTQQPPAPWYQASGVTNPLNLKLLCRVSCFGNVLGQYGTGITDVEAIGTQTSTQFAGKWAILWKFNINVSTLNIFPTANGLVTVNSISFTGSESTVKFGVFGLSYMRFIADGYESSNELDTPASGMFINVPTFGSPFEVGYNFANLGMFEPAASASDPAVINKNRTSANVVTSTITINSTENAFGLRPLITG